MTIPRNPIPGLRINPALLSVFLGSLLSGAFPVFAEKYEYGPSDLLGMDLKSLMEVEIISSASKYDQKITSAPASVTVVTEEDIRHYGYRNLMELLESVHGFYTYHDGTYPYLGVRGFSRPGDYGSRILLLVDGHRVNDNVFGVMDVPSNIDMDMVKRVEIVHGPSSSLYGTGAFLAVINVFTRSGGDLNGGEVSASLSRHEDLGARAAYGEQFGEDVELAVSVSKRDYPGKDIYIPHYDQPDLGDGISHARDGEDIERFFGKFRYRDLTLTASHIKRDKGAALPFGAQPFDVPNEFHDTRSYLELLYQRELGENWSTQARLSYNIMELESEYYAPAESPDLTYTVSGSEIKGDAWQGEWQWLWRKDRHQFNAGVEYQLNVSQQMSDYLIVPVWEKLGSIEVEDNDYWAVYLQDEITLGDSLILNIGVRHDRYQGLEGTTNPRAALIYQPSEQTTLKFMAGRAFRAPSTWERYYDSTFLRPHPEGVEPEIIQAYEVALEHNITSNLRGNLSVYHYKIEDLIEAVFNPEYGFLSYQNTAGANAHGLEAQLRKKWHNGAQTSLGYAWQQARREGGSRLSGQPRHLLKAHGSLPVFEDWRAALELRYIGSRETHKQPRADLSGYTLVNFTLGGELSKGLRLSASVYNLFDTEYDYPTSDDFAPDRFPGEGRNFRLKLEYHF